MGMIIQNELCLKEIVGSYGRSGAQVKILYTKKEKISRPKILSLTIHT